MLYVTERREKFDTFWFSGLNFAVQVFLVDSRKQSLHGIKTISEVTSAIPHEDTSLDAK